MRWRGRVRPRQRRDAPTLASVKIALDTTAVEIAAQQRLARLLDALPASIASRIGGHDLDVDGQVLDPFLH